MELSQIVRFIGESGYHNEVNNLASQFSGIILLEFALTANLAATYRNILSIAPGALKELAELYFSRYDIENVMLIMRGRQFGISPDKIHRVLIPAGVIGPSDLSHLLSLSSLAEIERALVQWKYYDIIRTGLKEGYQKGIFAELENSLYFKYYSDLLLDARFGVRGGDAIVPHLKLEIDILNLRNVFRLRAGSKTDKITPFIIPGGHQQISDFQRLYQINEREEFVRELERAGIIKVLTDALKSLRCDENVCESDATDIIWRRWAAHKTPLYSVMLSVNAMLLHHLDGLATRHPFSVLPIIAYLEHKRYEVMNLRAIARGLEFGVNPDFIRQHLVM